MCYVFRFRFSLLSFLHSLLSIFPTGSSIVATVDVTIVLFKFWRFACHKQIRINDLWRLKNQKKQNRKFFGGKQRREEEKRNIHKERKQKQKKKPPYI